MVQTCPALRPQCPDSAQTVPRQCHGRSGPYKRSKPHKQRVNLLNTMQLAANLSDTIAREMCHRKSETFAKNYFTFDPS